MATVDVSYAGLIAGGLGGTAALTLLVAGTVAGKQTMLAR